MENTETNTTSKIKNILTATQKHFIGSVLSATGIIFLLLSIMLFITLLLLIGFKLSILLEVIASGEMLTSLMIGLLTTGIVSFAIGTTLQNK